MQKRRYLRPLAIAAAILVIYALAGFFLVPLVATKLAGDAVRSEYGRDLRIGAIRFNPFTLRLAVDELFLPDADGSPLLTLDRLLVDLELNSIWRRALSFRAISLDGLALQAVIRRGGALNLAELQPARPPGPAPASDGSLPRLFIGELSLTQGRLRFEDRDRPEPFVVNVAPITFQLSNFSTYASDGERYVLDARLFDASRLSWRGTLDLNPLASEGEFAVLDLPLPRVLRYLGDALPLEVTSGTAALKGRYQLANRSTGLNFSVKDAALDAASLAVRPRGEEADYVTLDKLTARGVQMSLAGRSIQAGDVMLAGGGVQAWRSASGELNLAALAGPRPAQGKVAEASVPAEPPVAEASTAWQVRASRISIRDSGLDFEDRTVRPAVALALRPLDVTVEGFATAPGTSAKTTADVQVNGAGSVRVVATTNIDTLATEADIEAVGLELAFAQPYIAQRTSLELTGGSLTAKGRLTYAAATPAAQVVFTGEAGIERLRTIDNALREDFIKWDDLRLDGIEYRSAPESLRIAGIRARKPFARLIIGPDGTTNVAAILAGPGAVTAAAGGPTLGTAETRADPPAAVTNPDKTARPAAPFPVRIGVISIADGAARFADLTTRPNFDIGIGELKGSIKGLSSDPASRARVELAGQVGSYAPVTISGDVNPLAAERYLDMAMTFRNVELASFTPYAGRFAGYSIRQGKLSADLRYKVNDGKLDADHKFVLNQLELGDKVKSPDAVSLPLKLAVALLKDRDGTIDLDLPVQGDLDNPEFRVGPVVWKVLVGLLTKAVTAPFALLGRLFGGGEEINLIGFTPGDSAITAASEEKLQSLVKALAERPGLQLTVPAVFSREADSAALRETEVRKQLVTARRGELAAKKQPFEGVDYAAIVADPENHLRLLKAAYGQSAEPDPASQPPAETDSPASIRWYESALARRIAVADAKLFALAKARAEGVQSRLLTGTGIDPGRVFLVAPGDAKSGDDGVVMELALK
jgi:hypothetical protein